MYIYRLEEITPLVTGVKSLYYRLEEITSLVTGVKSYSIYIYIYMYITDWKKYRR